MCYQTQWRKCVFGTHASSLELETAQYKQLGLEKIRCSDRYSTTGHFFLFVFSVRKKEKEVEPTNYIITLIGFCVVWQLFMTFEHEPQGFVGSKYTNNSNKIFEKETIHYSHTSEYTAKLSDTSKRKDYLNVNRVKSLVCLILGNFLVTWLNKHISEVFNVLRKMPVQQQNKQSSCRILQ